MGESSGALTNPSTVPVAEGVPSQAQILEALKVVKDPEIPVNVVDLGLIYGIDVTPAGNVEITMTLTSVGCPVQDLIRSYAPGLLETSLLIALPAAFVISGLVGIAIEREPAADLEEAPASEAIHVFMHEAGEAGDIRMHADSCLAIVEVVQLA